MRLEKKMDKAEKHQRDLRLMLRNKDEDWKLDFKVVKLKQRRTG